MTPTADKLYSYMEPGPSVETVPAREVNLPDPVNLFPPVVEFFLPVGPQETNTMIGIWFDTAGLLNIYIQQAIVPDNIYTQIKIISLRIPVAFGFSIFNLGIAMFFARVLILVVRATTAEMAGEIQSLMQKIMDRVNYKRQAP